MEEWEYLCEDLTDVLNTFTLTAHVVNSHPLRVLRLLHCGVFKISIIATEGKLGVSDVVLGIIVDTSRDDSFVLQYHL